MNDQVAERDIRNIGLSAAVDLEALPGQPGLRALRIFEAGMQAEHLFRFTADTIAMAPPFISTEAEIEKMIEALRKLIRSVQ